MPELDEYDQNYKTETFHFFPLSTIPPERSTFLFGSLPLLNSEKSYEFIGVCVFIHAVYCHCFVLGLTVSGEGSLHFAHLFLKMIPGALDLACLLVQAPLSPSCAGLHTYGYRSVLWD